MNCELPSSVAVRERRTDPEGAPKHFVIPHGTDVRLEGGTTTRTQASPFAVSLERHAEASSFMPASTIASGT